MLPLSYNIRNLRLRWVTSGLTALVMAAIVWICGISFGLSDGLNHALTIDVNNLDVVVMRKGAPTEASSVIDERKASKIATLRTVATNADDGKLCSLEYVTAQVTARNDGTSANLLVRGVSPVAQELRSGFRIVEGRDIIPGKFEAITSRIVARRFHGAAIGGELLVNNVPFKVVGHFTANGSVAESEVWTDLYDLTGACNANGKVSSVLVRARDAASRERLIRVLRNDKQFRLKAITKSYYYERQRGAAVTSQLVGRFMATLLGLGGLFAAANTMHTAVRSRAREIGTMRALGFSRTSILVCFLRESLIICVVGGIIGCAAVVPFHGFSSGTLNWGTSTELTFSFRWTFESAAKGVLLTIGMGLFGGLLPAVRTATMKVTEALRCV